MGNRQSCSRQKRVVISMVVPSLRLLLQVLRLDGQSKLLYCILILSSFGLHGSDGYDDSEYSMDFHSSMSSLDAKRIEDDMYCNPNGSYVWCLPRDYNREKHPFSFSFMTTKPLPWNYDFKFVVEEISNINDKAQTMSISMYFGVSWLDPRIKINDTATEWREVKTGLKDEVNVSPESLKYIWYPELEIYGLEKFGRQRVLKEMSGRTRFRLPSDGRRLSCWRSTLPWMPTPRPFATTSPHGRCGCPRRCLSFLTLPTGSLINMSTWNHPSPTYLVKTDKGSSIH